MVETHRKTDPTMPPAFFAAEAASLRWLAEATACPVAAVVEVGADHLTLARLSPSAPTAEDAERFGHDLAQLHAAGAPGWGAGPPGIERAWLGTLEQQNAVEPTWGRFYAEHRVRPYARAARDTGAIDADGTAVLDRLCDRLAAGDFDDGSAPARLHGDLWSGNVITVAGGWTLIDPAAHGGHRLTDLAMLALFGNPHLERTMAAYAEAYALADGWLDLVALHQVHPLVVHAALFGGGYGRQAVEAARRFG
ncbi:fructosamine kinase family protein [Mariniluteicoccus flavus]